MVATAQFSQKVDLCGSENDRFNCIVFDLKIIIPYICCVDNLALNSTTWIRFQAVKLVLWQRENGYMIETSLNKKY
jgi:hypothetical protein